MKKLLIIFILSCVACTVHCEFSYAQIANPDHTTERACAEITKFPEKVQSGKGLSAVHTPIKPDIIKNTWYDAFLIVAVVLATIVAVVVIFRYIREKESTAKSILLLAFVLVLFGIFSWCLQFKKGRHRKN